MEFQEIFIRLNDGKLAPPTDKKKWEEASDRISVHAKGIRPQFHNPRKNRVTRTGLPLNGLQGSLVTPANYEERYQYLFDNYILNRHPNEQEEHYQFRLSVFPSLAQEIYSKGKSQISGSVFQNSQYTIAANDEADQQYLDEIEFEKRVKEQFFEHILLDPFGKFAVIETHYDEFGSDEKALPDIEIVESRYILHFEEKESILFQATKLIDGKKMLYYLDKQWCIKLIQEEAKKKSGYLILSAYEHNLGRLPVVDNGKELFKSFVTWADLIARNFSDDEIVAKNNNHPHIQMVESVCNECMGQRVVSYTCDSCEGGFQDENCHTCHGRGTISVNPGEVHVIRESEFRMGEMAGSNGMIDRIKFINPDVAISKNSFDRCWKIYEAGLRSLHLKHTEEAQSGTAKAIDREQLYLLISTCAAHIFEVADKLLTYIFGYLNMGIAEQKPYIIEQPTQFQIKTEADIQEEMIKLAGADLSVRRQKTDEYMQTVYSGNKVELKKWAIVKIWDYLFCMTVDEISTYKLLMGVNEMHVLRHTMVDVLLNQIIDEKGVEWFINAKYSEVKELLDTQVEAFKPATRIIVPPKEAA